MADARPPALPLTVDELLTTTRTVRRRLDLGRPVPRAVVEHCLRIAFQTPNGRNQQAWSWILVDDPATRRAMADLYRAGLEDHLRRDVSGEAPVDSTSPAAIRMRDSVSYLVDVLQDVPVLLVPTIEPAYSLGDAFGVASAWGSILPAVWSFMLALRSRGLGSAWTTLHLYREREMAELLGFPHPDQLQVGLFPVAYTLGTSFHPADRRLSESKIFWNRWSAGSTP
jgi:nitroreductase